MAGLKVLVPPAIEPVGLDEVKMQLRIDEDDESYDAILDPLVVSAREWCEGYQNRAYITQTLQLALDAWPCAYAVRLPQPPLQSIESVEYTDNAAANNVWPASNYSADSFSEPGRLIAAGAWPSGGLARANGVMVTYKAGYGDDATAVPQKVKQAIIMLTCHWFDNGMCDPPDAVLSLLSLDRVVPV